MITLDTIQKRLSEEIERSNLSRATIASRINVCHQTVSHYVKGDKMPALDTFANLCIVLDVDPAYILGIKND
ncbi:MAG: helix-turn-helix transcriptional regulator [Clostridia bacterium]|nr:helix-turn-helix transcriptional regulator [Clostridia bacterium]